jgi:ATP-binding cassette subfamily B (MDR/TAP) protein 6
MIDMDNASRATAVDSLLNFETVKYYNNEDFEIKKYRDAIIKYQEADWKASASLNVLNTAQNATITVGLLVGCLLCANRIVNQQMGLGDFVLFMTYIVQLYQPLNWFGTYYRVIQQNFIDMEKMMELFEQTSLIKDDPDAKELNATDGHIVFDDVCFQYDEKTAAVHNLSFKVEPGQFVAFVGPSGAGKSTIFRVNFTRNLI